MGCLGLVLTVISGAIIGVIAGWLMPGPHHYGFWVDALIGIVGSFVGGLLGNLVNPAADGPGIQPAGCIMSVIGAMIVIAIGRYVLHVM